MKMKLITKNLILIVGTTLTINVQSQNCFQDFLKRGEEAYGLYQFQQAIDLFNAAKICPENSDDQIVQIDDWINKANNGYINEITKARDEALVLQKQAVKQARMSEANRIAYLAAQELEKRNLDDALFLAFTGLDMIAGEPQPQTRQIFGNVTAARYAVTLSGHGKAVLDTEFLPDGRVWSRASDQTLIIWGANGVPDTVLGRDDQRMVCSAASKDGRSIAAGFENGDMSIWDATGDLLIDHKGTSAVNDITFSQDGSQLATSCRDGSVKIWSSSGDLHAKSGPKNSATKEIQFMEGGKSLVTRSAAEVQILDLEAKLQATVSHQQHVYLFLVSPDQTKILTCSADSTAKLSTLSGKMLVIFPHPAKVHKGTFSPDGQHLLTAALDQNIRCWDLNGNLIWTVKGDETTIESIMFSPDGNYLLSYASGNVAKLWSNEGLLLANLDRHTGSILASAFSPDSKFILTTSADRTAKLWDVAGQMLMNANQYAAAVTLGKFSADGKRILTASADGRLTMLQNPVDVFKDLQINKPVATEDQKVKFGLNATQ